MPGGTLMNEELSGLAASSKQPELLVSAVLHLMSHYTVNNTNNVTREEAEQANTKLASVIERHLKVLANLPDLAPVLQATCQQLSEQWAGLVEKKTAQQTKLRKLGWLLAFTGKKSALME
ncbi:hypothetical protein ACO0LC_07540 [Undibacterium sp. JH2W]|uniref:hypothetical protein n=1 Tax=Undibacterium sp. JH2W TaxID=3413037 RepID=UPI003BF443DA